MTLCSQRVDTFGPRPRVLKEIPEDQWDPLFPLRIQKGGVGKTTTAVNLSASVAVAEKTCLLVDCDPQGNATTGLGIERKSLEKGLYEFHPSVQRRTRK